MTSQSIKLKRFQIGHAVVALGQLAERDYHLIHTPKVVLALDHLEPALQTMNKLRQKLVSSYAIMVEGDKDKGERDVPMLDAKGNVEFGDDEDGRKKRGQCQAALEDFDNEEMDITFPLDAVKMHNSELKANGQQAFALRFMVDSAPKVAPAKAAKK